MPTPTVFVTPYDNAYASLSVAHTSGGAALTLNTISRYPASGSFPIYATVMHPTTSGTTIFKATSLVGTSLSGLTVIGQNADATYPTGSPVEMRIVAQHFTDFANAINALEGRPSGITVYDRVNGAGTFAIPFYSGGLLAQDSGILNYNPINKSMGLGMPANGIAKFIIKGDSNHLTGQLLGIDSSSTAGGVFFIITSTTNAANLPGQFQIQQSGVGPLLTIDTNGKLTAGYVIPVVGFAQINSFTKDAGTIGLGIKNSTNHTANLIEMRDANNNFMAGAYRSGEYIQKCLSALPSFVPPNGTTVFVSGDTPYLAIYNGAWRSGLFV
jgi:hypothetical protein